MDDEFELITNILRKVFPKLLENPRIMTGCDVSSKEIEDIEDTQNLSLDILQHAASDEFFQTYNKKLGITTFEGEEIDKFIYQTAKHYI